MDFHTKAIILSDLSVIHKYVSVNTSLGYKCLVVFHKNDTVLRNFYYVCHINYVINHILYLQVIEIDILKDNHLGTNNNIKDGQSYLKLSYPNFYMCHSYHFINNTLYLQIFIGIEILKYNNSCKNNKIKDGQSHTKLSYPNFYPVRCIDILKCNNLCTHTQIFIERYII